MLPFVAGEPGQLQLPILALLRRAEEQIVLPRAGVVAKPVRLIRRQTSVEGQTGRKIAGLIADAGEFRSEGAAADARVGRGHG